MLKCYKGFSLDKELYEKGSTGGVATTLALIGLKYGYAEGMVVLNRAINPPAWVIAKTKRDFLKACGSTYEDRSFLVITEANDVTTRLGQIGKPCDIIQGFTPRISIFCSHTYRTKREPITKDYARQSKSKVRTLFENPVKCFLCKDHVGLEADVNVGDSQEDAKVNVLITRTALGMKLVELAISHEFLQLEEEKYSKIREKQPYLWRH